MDTDTATTALRTARLGNGTAIHLADDDGILCNRWGTVNGKWMAPRFVEGVTATCKRCQKIAA